LSRNDLDIAMQAADDGGYQLAVHAIGDLGNRRLIDAAIQNGYGEDHRWRIEHTQILDPADIPRMAKSGLIASMQPSHAIGDLKFAPARLGMARLAGAYAWHDLHNAGIVVVGGSDAPVEVGSPLIEFYAAVARKDLEGQSGEGWHPEQALSREDALELFTSAPAYAAFMEDEVGTLEAGKIADMTVFDTDLMSVPEAQILDAQAVMTVVQGEIVWQRPN
jgi:predicted amidohydrolase YtcJ